MDEISPLRNTIKSYEWGSRTAIASILGRPTASEEPQAELWMGAHPAGSSEALRGGTWVPLADLIREAPEPILGRRVADRWGGVLPFLLKVLAAEQPLSIQLHPDAEQAAAGFARESRRGLPLDAAERNYRDPRPKPEILHALEPFELLGGFRPAEEILQLLTPVAPPELLRVAETLRRPAGLRGWFESFLAAPAERRRRWVSRAARRARPLRERRPEYRWVVDLDRQYPGDPGVLAPLFLRLVALAPGDTLFTPPGVLHSYLRGVALELQGNSDNVLRGGLTSKHVDVAELLSILRYEGASPQLLEPSVVAEGGERFLAPTGELALRRLRIRGGEEWRREGSEAVEILWCAEGSGSIRGRRLAVELRRGSAVLVPAAVPSYTVAGEALLYIAETAPCLQ